MRNTSPTRRKFFASSGALLTSSAVSAIPSLAAGQTAPVDYYDKLGVTKIINAAGTYTFLTASIMPPQVQAAVAQAAKHPVRLKELQEAAGRYLATKLKCEGALVTRRRSLCIDARDSCLHDRRESFSDKQDACGCGRLEERSHRSESASLRL